MNFDTLILEQPPFWALGQYSNWKYLSDYPAALHSMIDNWATSVHTTWQHKETILSQDLFYVFNKQY